MKPKKAFTLIELLVVIAIIGILATVSVLALSNVRAKSRDAKRAGDVKQIQTALELFFNDNNRYPTIEEWNTGKIYSTTTGVTSTYMQIIPNAPTPADGSCTSEYNNYVYSPVDNGSSYSISYCLGGVIGELSGGNVCATPGGVISGYCAEAITFVKRYGVFFRSAQQTIDGGYIIAGDSYGDDAYLIKIDADGNEQWLRTFNKPMSQYIRSVQQTTDGGYILAGITEANGNFDAYMIKADSSGNEVWSKNFGGAGQQQSSYVQQTSDGGYILIGNELEISRPYFIKTDSSGNEVWSKKINISDNYPSYFSSGQQTSDGGYIFSGLKELDDFSRNFYLVKTDSSGNEVWSKNFGGAGDQQAYSVQQTSDGGYIMVGDDYGNSNTVFYVVKTDSGGNEVWSKNFGDSNYNQYAHFIRQTRDGGYIVAGETDTSDIYLVKTNSSGDEVWSKKVGNSNDEESAYYVQETTDGGYFMVGSSYIIKTDILGNYKDSLIP
ncbi:MAG: prepilin-type N-terminal cleavage/methylation domain-containing protein [Candidatus Falkowbacteria bacterium]